MGNRTYLTIKRAGEQEDIVLFESNNSLPLFWLTLLTPEDIEAKRPVYRQLFDLSEEDEDLDNVPTDFIVPQPVALVNTQRCRPHLAEHHPDLLPLYEDWVAFLEQAESSDSLFYLDFTEYSSFFDSADEFVDVLLRVQDLSKQNIDFGEHSIGGLTGWDGWNNGRAFYKFSAAYREQPQIRDEFERWMSWRRPNIDYPAQPWFIALKWLVSLMLLALGILLCLKVNKWVGGLGFVMSPIVLLMAFFGFVWADGQEENYIHRVNKREGVDCLG